MKNRFVVLILLVCLSCNTNEIPTPKPRTYPRVEFPAKDYKRSNIEQCAFSFEIPGYAEIKKDKYFFGEDAPDACWFDIIYGPYNGKLHCSYFPIDNKMSLDSLVQDAFELVGKHRVKADFRDEYVIRRSRDVSGILFEMGGPVASPVQFFLTDSTTNFLRGALYFENKVNPDSMTIVHEFIKKDIEKLIESFTWN